MSERYAALKYRDFRLLWFGRFVSIIGTQMQIVALNWHIYLLTHSAVALGILGLIRFIPIVVFSLISGSVVDAHNRKKILFLTQVSLGLLALVLAFTTFTNVINPIVIYVIAALEASIISFDTPARQAFIPNLVDKKHLHNATSLNFIMFETATILGPAIAGFFIGFYGVGPVYALNAVSFVAVLIALAFIKHSGVIEGEKGEVSLSSVIEGLRFVKSKTIVYVTMLLDFFSTFFASATVLLPIYAKDILNVGPQGLGLLYSASSVGAVLAAFGMAHFGHLVKRQGKVLLLAIGVYGLATIVFGFSHWFSLSFIALALIGIGDSISAIYRNTIRTLETPDSMRGRMASISMIFFMGGPQLGEFEAGLLASAVGAPLSVVLGGVGVLVVVSVVGLLIPEVRRYKTPNPT